MKNCFGLQFGIVIIGYKNVQGIKRLLSSLDRVDFGKDELLLILSIDHSNDNGVENIAKEYNWLHGEKIVKTFENNLGLKTHILKCGDYLEEYNLDALIVLEDDLYLSPNMYYYALNSVEYYINDNSIAGISLYKHEYNIYAKHPFIDYKDGHDVFFMQYAQSWGQVWIRSKWKAFKEWYDNKEWENLDRRLIPENVLKWKNSWLKYHIMYCIAKDLYFVYPRESLTTNFSDAGVHGSRQNTDMQVAFVNKPEKKWNFSRISDSDAVYDAFFQNIRIKEICGLENVSIDLYGVKEILPGDKYVLTLKEYNYRIVKGWALQFRPIEANIFYNITGHDILLYELETSEQNKHSNWKIKLFEYDKKGLRTASLACYEYNIVFVVNYFRNKYKQIRKKWKLYRLNSCV